MEIEYNDSQKIQYKVVFGGIKVLSTLFVCCLVLFDILLAFPVMTLTTFLMSLILGGQFSMYLNFWVAVALCVFRHLKDTFTLNTIYSAKYSNVKIFRCAITAFNSKTGEKKLGEAIDIFSGKIMVESDDFNDYIYYLDVDEERLKNLKSGEEVDIITINNDPVFAIPKID